MSVRSALFSLKLLPNQELDESVLTTVFDDHFPGIALASRVQLIDGLIFIYGANDNRLTITVRHYKSQQLVSINGEECVDSETIGKTHSLLNNSNSEKLRSKLVSALNVPKVERIPTIKKWTVVPNYYTSSDERLLEYDFDSVVFEEHSQYQHIKILGSPSLGNCLLLDDLQNLAEKDLSYTRGLMKYGEISYKDKEILILGGGDGGLLHELLKEEPKFVTMVDIDAVVLNACKKYLRGACGDTLDNFDGPNYQVIVGDCLKYMEQYIGEKRSFDFVFNDLTDIPISAQDNRDAGLDGDEDLWTFFKRILNLALKLVRPDGFYLNHAIGIGCKSTLETYEQLLRSLPVKVEFSRHSAYVPSFMEDWVFYQIWKVN
ncbi:spermine synthase-like [Oppia nitens]|uniref:spermine synthase-like n=1 Tax=Oppia nitens TaxID=1686743 RepID=UPI0023D9DC39|nr:spermine synthase-like [Oppia nitens]